MNSAEKLLKAKVGIKSEQELFDEIDKSDDDFFEFHFLMSKKEYASKIKELIAEINSKASIISEMSPAARSGSIIETFAKSELSDIRSGYITARKILVFHASMFGNYKLKDLFS